VTIPVNVLLLLVVAGVSSASCGEAGVGAHEQAHLGTDHPFFRLLRLSRVSPVPLTKEQMLTASEVIAVAELTSVAEGRDIDFKAGASHPIYLAP
jgi:hypothetical protein